MSLNGTWDNEEDFERDLLLFAEFSVTATPEVDARKKVEEPESPFDIPKTIINYEKRMEENKRSLVAGTNFDEGRTYFVSGRGRGIRDRIIRPGEAVTPDPSDDVELKKMIRQVSGLGYSNELIEKHIEAMYSENEAKTVGDSSNCVSDACGPKTSLETAASSSCALPKEGGVPKKGDGVPKNKSAGNKGRKGTSSYASSVKSSKGPPNWFDRYAKPKDYNLDSDFPPLK